jgi:hypothetical protein
MAKTVAKAAKGRRRVASGANQSSRTKKGVAGAQRPVARAVRKPLRPATTRKTPAAQAMPATARLVEDQLAIQQLLHKYCHAVDRGTLDDVTDLFHRYAVLLPRYESDDRYEGRDAVRGWYERYFENLRSKVRYLRHKISSPVIEITGNEATSVCYLDADSVAISTNEPIVSLGRYEDKFVKEGGRWWIKERTIIVYYSYPLATYREGRGG